MWSPISRYDMFVKSATCTAPEKCSCGKTKGAALGHKWQDATCKTPKTCSVCKATEGNIGTHKYDDGNCVYSNSSLFEKGDILDLVK